MKDIEKLFNVTRMATCENLDCRENKQGECALKQMTIDINGKCGWFIPKDKND